MDESSRPIGLDVHNREQKLEIRWADGHTSSYPLFGLRKNCPCVVCRGGHSTMNEFEPGAFFINNPPIMNISNINQIGNHAIQIVWMDGHNSGMYRWETLRWLDPVNHSSSEF